MDRYGLGRKSDPNMDEAIKSEIYRKGEELTGGLNLNSNQQMLKWIEEQEGYAVSGLDKDTRDALLKNPKTTPQVRKFLEYKEVIGKISTKKIWRDERDSV